MSRHERKRDYPRRPRELPDTWQHLRLPVRLPGVHSGAEFAALVREGKIQSPLVAEAPAGPVPNYGTARAPSGAEAPSSDVP